MPSPMPAPRDVTINGEPQQVTAANLADVVHDLGFGEARLATALNGDFVPAARRKETALKSGDRIEIVTARQGG